MSLGVWPRVGGGKYTMSLYKEHTQHLSPLYIPSRQFFLVQEERKPYFDSLVSLYQKLQNGGPFTESGPYYI